MKVLLGLLLTRVVIGATISYIGPCDSTPLLEKEYELNKEVSVGQLTIKSLDEAGVKYRGSESHLESAFNTPYGLDAMEVISDTKMRSHGWCFDVNGRTSQVYPNDYKIDQDDHILWYYCYVSYDSGVWSNSHRKTHEIAPAQFCSKSRN